MVRLAAAERREGPPRKRISVLSRVFSFVVKWRWFWVVLYALALPPFGYFAARVQQDSSIERLIVASDPDFARTKEFQKVFGAGEFAVVAFEAPDPFDPGVLERVDEVEKALSATKGLDANSAIGIFRRAKAGFSTAPETVAAFKEFSTKTDLFRKQGLVGDDFLALALVLQVESNEGRRALLAEIEKALAKVEASPGPIRAVRRLGQPYVSSYLDDTTNRTANRLFALFMGFVVVLTLALYRSVRTLIAFLLTLVVCLVLSVGYIGITGGSLSIVSPMVPMTILVTTLATLVYLQSRFVEKPDGVSVDEHQVFSLSNKFVACTASIFATAVGFAALAVSSIRPIFEMGIWVAIGLSIAWVVIFTLFPALQKILKTPTSEHRATAAPWFEHLVEWLPGFSYRYRWALVIGSLVLSAGGAVALFGLRGAVKPMQLLVNPMEYISKDSREYKDYQALGPKLPGTAISSVWLKAKSAGDSMSEPEMLDALHRFTSDLEKEPEVGAAIGPTTILRITQHVSGQSDAWPADAEAQNELAGLLEGLLPVQPMLQRFMNRSATQAQIAIVSKTTEHEGFQRLQEKIQASWRKTVESTPAMRGKDGADKIEMYVVGLSPLQAKMSQSLVPTLVESFAITVAIIFATFLVVFRSGAARVMAMIPSLFAILVMFGVMRLTGMSLNVATILIASTVLGTSENDQIHFFYHFQEKRKDGSVEASLKHTLRVAGKAIVFATLINAGGFLAFALADLPPMREFGILTALAFVLSMVADFTALPAALWLVFRAKPDALVEKPEAAARVAKSEG
jgi:predicted RND superfamily exporter protein